MKPKALATVLFAAVGFYAIVSAIELSSPLVSAVMSLLRLTEALSAVDIARALLTIAAVPVLLLVAGLMLILRPPLAFIEKRAGHEGLGHVGLSCNVILRAGVMVIGLAILATTSLELIVLTALLPMKKALGDAAGVSLWVLWAKVAAGVVLGVYLFSGAPHLVGGMARRIERSAEAEEDDDDTPQPRPRVTT